MRHTGFGTRHTKQFTIDNHRAATAANTEGITMDYSTYAVECLSLCYEWFGYTYHLDGDSQQVNADLEEQESAS